MCERRQDLETFKETGSFRSDPVHSSGTGKEYHFPDRKMYQSSNLEMQIENLSSLFPNEKEGIEQVYRILRKILEEYSEIPSSLDWFDPPPSPQNFLFFINTGIRLMEILSMG
jgi:hypothetical protein